jgi:ubiquinone/menaquinone biosynthesis C-methylase UbiE
VNADQHGDAEVAVDPPEGPDSAEVKDGIASVFGAAAGVYDQSGVDFFGLFARRLVARLAPDPGWHVVDVGAGRGAVTFALADALGPQGRVTAVDLAPEMVQALAADLEARRIGTVSAQVGDVEDLDLPPGSADAVTASMVLFFLPDLNAGLRSIRRVLRPGGLLAFSVFAEADPGWERVYASLQAQLPDPDPGEDLSRPRHPHLSSPRDIDRALEAAGLDPVGSWHETHPIHFDSVDQWHAWSWSIGLRGTWLQIPEHRRPEATRAVLAEVGDLRSGDGSLTEDFAVHYVIARRPG